MKAKMHALALLSFVVALCLALCVACTTTPTLGLDQTELQLTVGQTATITADTDEEVEWSSSDEGVVTVDDGLVTAVGEGTATVTATAGDAVGECTVTVTASTEKLSVALSQTSLDLKIGEERTVVATATQGGNVVQATFTWSSEDDSVATVTNGEIAAVAIGETRIAVTAAFGGEETTAYIAVTVKLDAEIELSADSFSLSVLALCDDDMQTATAGATLYYQGAAQSGISFTYTSDDEDVFTVDQEGVLTAVGAGDATLTVSTVFMESEITAECDVEVVTTNNVEFEVDFGDYDTAMLNEAMGEYDLTQQISASVTPWDESLNVEWVSSDNMIASVEYDGLTATVEAEEGCLGGEAIISLYVEGIEVGYVVIGVYFPISTEQDIIDINNSDQALTSWYLMTNDIRLENVYEFSLVTRNENETWGKTFGGVFDGNGYTISNFRMGDVLETEASANGTWNMGIIGYNTGVVRNLRVETEPYSWINPNNGIEYTTSLRTASGAVVAYNEGIVENCIAVVDLTNAEQATRPGGGIVGTMGENGILRDCYVEVNSIGTIIPDHAATQNNQGGAFLGAFYSGTLENCWGLKVDNALIQPVGYDEGSSGEQIGNVLVTSKADLIAAGFGAETFDGEVWNIAVDGDDYTVQLNKGFRFKLDQGAVTCTVGAYTAMVSKAVTGYNNTQEIELAFDRENVAYSVSVSAPELISVEAAGNTVKVTALESFGGTASVTVSVDGEAVASFNIEVYAPVSTEADLAAIDDSSAGLSGKYLMINDIELETVYGSAIVTQNVSEKWNGSFQGVFDGNGYTISNFRMNSTWNMGIFGYNRGVIRNLCVETENYNDGVRAHVFNIRSSSGAIAAVNGGTIENCIAVVDMVNPESATKCGGAIVGIQETGGSVKNCYTEVQVHSIIPDHVSAAYNVGAIVGDLGAGTVENCWSVKQDAETIQICGRFSGDASAETSVINSHLATDKAGLIEAGFDAETFDGGIWNVAVEGSSFTVALRNGCTVAAVSA